MKGETNASSGGRADACVNFMLTQASVNPKTDVQIMPLSGGSAIHLAADSRA